MNPKDLFLDSDDFHDIDKQNELIQQLREQNSELIKRNANIKNENDEGIDFGLMEKLKQQLFDEKAKNRSLLTEKNDYETRYQLIVKQLKETEQNSLNRENNSFISIANGLKERIATLEKELQFHKDSNSQNQEIIVGLRTELEKYRINNNNVSSFLNSISGFFSRSFNSLKELEAFIINKPKEPVECNISPTKTSDDSQKKLIKYKKRLQKVYAELDQQNNDLEEMKNFYENTIIEMKSQYSHLKNQMDDINNQKKKIGDEKEEKITSLKSQIVNMQNTIDQMRQKVLYKEKEDNNDVKHFENELQTSLDRANYLEGVIRDHESLIGVLKQHNSNLLSSIELSKEKSQKRIDQLVGEKAELNNELLQSNSTKASLELDVMSLKEQLNTALAQVKSASISFNQSKDVVEEIQISLKHSNEAISTLESIIQKQKDEITYLYNDREKVCSLLIKHNQILKHAESLSYPKISSGDPIPIHNTQIVPEIKEVRIPKASWFSPEMPKDLNQLISDFANNDSLTDSSKLKNILSTVSKYYIKQTGEITNSYEIKLSLSSETLDKIHQSMESIIMILQNAVQFDVTDMNLHSVLSSIIEDYTCSKIDLERSNDSIRHICELLSINSMKDIIPTLEQLMQSLHQYENDVLDQNSIIKKQKKQLKKYGYQLAGTENEIEDVVSQMKQNENYLLSEIEGLNKEKEQLHDQIIALQNTKLEIEQSYQNQIGEQEFSHMEEKSLIENELKQKISFLESIIVKKDHERDSILGQVQSLQKEVSQWKKASELYKNDINEKDQRISHIQSLLDEFEQKTRVKISEEREMIRGQYQNLIMQLKEENDKKSLLYSNVSNALHESEDRLKEKNSELIRVAQLNNQIEKVIISKEEEIKREKRLIDAKSKAQILSIEMKYQSKIEDMYYEFDNEKRKLINFVVNQFSMFYDASQPLSLECLILVTEKACKELIRLNNLEESLKRLLGVHSESIEDAVSKIILSFFK